MATKYCDHDLYGAPVAAGTVPTAAEDGNGKGKTAATMATFVISFSGLPAAGQAVTVAGVAFTAKASGATGNQFNIGADATATATNLRNAINASTTNAIKPTGVIAATAPLRNVVNACSSGGVVTVYTRCAGSDWNSVVETSTLSNCTLTQWSGGADGAWGYIRNITAAIAWPTSVAANAYGIWSASPCYLGTLAVGDVCKVRAGKTLTFPVASSSKYIESAYVGTTSGYVTYEIDDGTEWPADGSTPVLEISASAYNPYGFFVWTQANYYICVKAKKYAGGARNLVFKSINPGGYGVYGTLVLGGSNGTIIDNVKLTGSASMPNIGALINYGARSVFNGCVIEQTADGNVPFVFAGSNAYSINAELNNCEFIASGKTTPTTLASLFNNYTQSKKWIFNGCSCSGLLSGSQLVAGTTYYLDNNIAFFRDCSFPNITVTGPISLSGAAVNILPGVRGVYASSRTRDREFSMENPGLFFIDWNKQRGRPTLNARLLDGITPWSIYAITSTTAGNVTRNVPVELPTISKLLPAAGDLAEAVRTVKVNFLLESTLSWGASDVSVFLTYTDTDGNPAVTDSFNVLGGSLSASAAAWSATSWNGLSWVPYEFSIATDKPVKAETEICATLRIHTTVANVNQGMIFDPELLIS